jgi:hypothetical protein
MESAIIVNKRDIEQTNAHKKERMVIITIIIDVGAENAVTKEEETMVEEANAIIEKHVVIVAKLATWNAIVGNLQKIKTEDLTDIAPIITTTITIIITRTNKEMLLETMDPTLSTC